LIDWLSCQTMDWTCEIELMLKIKKMSQEKL
jgi:hypothetical protein